MKGRKKVKGSKGGGSKNAGAYVKKQLAAMEGKSASKPSQSHSSSSGSSSYSGSSSGSSSGSESVSSECYSSEDDSISKERAEELAERYTEEGKKLSKKQMDAALRIEQDEGRSGYKDGGYHPVAIGDTFKEKRYKVYSKVGWGHFSTVWKAKDNETGQFVALKIVRSAWQYTEAARDEIKFLDKLASADKERKCCCMHLLDHFIHFGPNGHHECMVFELLGSNLLDLIRIYHYRGIPVRIVKYITKQILIALDFIHRVCGVIHTDLKPENVLLGMTITEELYRPDRHPSSSSSATASKEVKVKEGEGESKPEKVDSEKEKVETPAASAKTVPPFEELYKVYLADFGNANWIKKHFTDDIQTRQYRAPEVILGAPWSTTVDLWSLACMVFELLTGEYLFEPKSGSSYSKEDDHLCQMIELLGPMPKSLMKGKHVGKYFNKRGGLLHIPPSDMKEWTLFPILRDKYQFSEKDAQEITDFLLPMLEYEPLKRASAQAMLKHPWVSDI